MLTPFELVIQLQENNLKYEQTFVHKNVHYSIICSTENVGKYKC